MSTENVMVTFKVVNGQDTWQFDRPKVPIGEPSKIILHREPRSDPFTFKNIEFPDGDDGQFSWEPGGNGRILTIDDACTNTEEKEYCYKVIVTDASGTDHTSPDPQIVNSPGGMLNARPPSVALRVAIGLVAGAIVGAIIDMNTGSLESRGPFKGAIVGAIIGAILGYVMARARRKP